MEKYISLKIAGNPDSSSGCNPLINENNAIIDIQDRYPVGFDNSPYTIMVRINGRQIEFIMYVNGVHSAGADRKGRLMIAIAIPRDYAIADGVSPFDALKDAFDTFTARYMTQSGNEWDFKANLKLPLEPLGIYRKYPLVHIPGPWVEMPAQGPEAFVVAPEDKIREMFRDMQYPEFTRFSAVFVAPSVTAPTATHLPVAIPRVHTYTVILNGNNMGTVTDGSKTLEYPVDFGEFYETATSPRFTFDTLRSGTPISGVTYDPVTETATVTVTPRPRTQTFQVTFVNELMGIDRRKLRVAIDGVAIALSPNQSFSRVGEEIDLQKSKITVKYDGNDFIVSPDVQLLGNNLIINGRKARQVSRDDAEAVLVNLPDGFRFDRAALSTELNIAISATGNTKLPEFTARVPFEKELDGSYFGIVAVPASFGNTPLIFSFDHAGVEYTSAPYTPRKGGRMSWTKRAVKASPLPEKFLWAIGGFILGVVVAVASVWAFNRFFPAAEPQTEQVTDAQPAPQPDPKATVTDVDSIQNAASDTTNIVTTDSVADKTDGKDVSENKNQK